MKHTIPFGFLVFFVVLTLLSNPSFARSTEAIRRTGDVLQIALPATAYGMTYLLDDAQGRGSFLKTFFLTTGTTYMLKYAVPDERPDGGKHAFISGHTSASFAGAAFIQRRYGWKYGIPAYWGAAFVGWSRVESGRHDTNDVLRGAAIGILSTYIFTEPYKGNVCIAPFIENHTVGVVFQGAW